MWGLWLSCCAILSEVPFMLWFCQLSPPYFFASTPYELVAIASRLAPKQICTYTYLKKPNRTHNSSFLMTYLNTPPLLEFYSSSTIFPKTYNFFFGHLYPKTQPSPQPQQLNWYYSSRSFLITSYIILPLYYLILAAVSTTTHSFIIVYNLCCPSPSVREYTTLLSTKTTKKNFPSFASASTLYSHPRSVLLAIRYWSLSSILLDSTKLLLLPIISNYITSLLPRWPLSTAFSDPSPLNLLSRPYLTPPGSPITAKTPWNAWLRSGSLSRSNWTLATTSWR